jgi:hypothetical protein
VNFDPVHHESAVTVVSVRVYTMLAVLPFLIQWIALSQLGNQLYLYKQGTKPKSHWSLLHELQKLPEEEIDYFLPQVCNIMLDRLALEDEALHDYFESVVEQKCADCFSFGTKVCSVLKVLSSN